MKLATVVWLCLACACGKGDGKFEIKTKIDTKDTVEHGPASFEDVADLKPSLDVKGPAGAYLDAVKAALATDSAAHVEVEVGPAVPSGSSGTLDTTVRVYAMWWELPNTTKAKAELTFKVDYSGADAKLVGTEVGEKISKYLAERRPKRAVLPKPAPPAIGIAVGKSIACSLHNDQSVHCWGSQLGDIVAHVPSKAPIQGATDVAAGDRAVCARTTAGDVTCIGHLEQKDAGKPKHNGVSKVCDVTAPTKLALGAHHGCALVDGGKVMCWDTDVHNSPDPSCGHKPGAITVGGKELTGATDLAVGFGGGCALVAGKAKCWPNGELAAKDAGLPAGAGVVVGFRPCVVSAKGQMTCQKEKGLEYIVETAVPEGAHIELEPMHGCAITKEAKLLCWGSISELLDGTKDGKEPQPILDDVVAAGVAISSTCAVKKDGSVWCAGRDAGAATGLAKPTTKLTQLTIY